MLVIDPLIMSEIEEENEQIYIPLDFKKLSPEIVSYSYCIQHPPPILEKGE
jgi:hypothetical protein